MEFPYGSQIPPLVKSIQKKISKVEYTQDQEAFYVILNMIDKYWDKLDYISYKTHLDKKYDVMTQLFLDMHLEPCGIKINIIRDSDNNIYFERVYIDKTIPKTL